MPCENSTKINFAFNFGLWFIRPCMRINLNQIGIFYFWLETQHEYKRSPMWLLCFVEVIRDFKTWIKNGRHLMSIVYLLDVVLARFQFKLSLKIIINEKKSKGWCDNKLESFVFFQDTFFWWWASFYSIPFNWVWSHRFIQNWIITWSIRLIDSILRK